MISSLIAHTGARAFDEALAQQSIEDRFTSNLDLALKRPSSSLQHLLIEARHSQRLIEVVKARHLLASASQREEIEPWFHRLDPDLRGRALQGTLSRQTMKCCVNSAITEYLEIGELMAFGQSSHGIRQKLGTLDRCLGVKIARDATAIHRLSIEKRTETFIRLRQDTLKLNRDDAKVGALSTLAGALCELPLEDRAAQWNALFQAVLEPSPDWQPGPLTDLFAALRGTPHPVPLRHVRTTLENRPLDQLHVDPERCFRGPVPREGIAPLFSSMWQACLSLQPPRLRGSAFTELLDSWATEDGYDPEIGTLNDVLKSGDLVPHIDILPTLLDRLNSPHITLNVSSEALNDMLRLSEQLMSHDPVLVSTVVLPKFITAIHVRDNPVGFGRLLNFIDRVLEPQNWGPSLVAMAQHQLSRIDPEVGVAHYVKLLTRCWAIPAGELKFTMRLKLTEYLCFMESNGTRLEAPIAEVYQATQAYEGTRKLLLLAHLSKRNPVNTGCNIRALAAAQMLSISHEVWPDDVLCVLAEDCSHHKCVTLLISRYPRPNQADILIALTRAEMAMARIRQSEQVDATFLRSIVPLLAQLSPVERVAPLQDFTTLLQRIGEAQAREFMAAIVRMYLDCAHDVSLMAGFTEYAVAHIEFFSDDLRADLCKTLRRAMRDTPDHEKATLLPTLLNLAQALDNEEGTKLHALLMQDWRELDQRHPWNP